ncbi:STYX protein, partial [Amia calva]|nr:STYX protein [Amia calva]
EILPGLYLGPYSAAMKSKLPVLEKQGITHIVCVRQDIEANFIKPNFPQKFRYLVLDIADNPVENIIRYFPMTKEFIDGCLQDGGKVLVHGNAGISRSAALVIAYLMETFGVKYRDAFSHVQERRFCINPNVGFVHQLQARIRSNLFSQAHHQNDVPNPAGPPLLRAGWGSRSVSAVEFNGAIESRVSCVASPYNRSALLSKLSCKSKASTHLPRVCLIGSLKRTLEEDEDFGGMQVTAAQNG